MHFHGTFSRQYRPKYSYNYVYIKIPNKLFNFKLNKINCCSNLLADLIKFSRTFNYRYICQALEKSEFTFGTSMKLFRDKTGFNFTEIFADLHLHNIFQVPYHVSLYFLEIVTFYSSTL